MFIYESPKEHESDVTDEISEIHQLQQDIPERWDSVGQNMFWQELKTPKNTCLYNFYKTVFLALVKTGFVQQVQEI